MEERIKERQMEKFQKLEGAFELFRKLPVVDRLQFMDLINMHCDALMAWDYDQKLTEKIRSFINACKHLCRQHNADLYKDALTKSAMENLVMIESIIDRT